MTEPSWSFRVALRTYAPRLARALASCRDLLAGRQADALARVTDALARLTAENQAAAERLQALEHGLAEHDRQLGIRVFMEWIAQAVVPETRLVSVVLPTRDRSALLPRAIASITRQTYANWELLVVDDGSKDATADVLGSIDDKRIRIFRSKGRGVCAARNIALAQARGDFIAYLDDDNMMHADWLKSVVWAFGQRSDATVLYGAFLVDDPARIDPQGGGELPRLVFFPYDHHDLAESNIADIGCIAHRAGLPEARFDESLLEMGDWDLFLRLTKEAPPLTLPAIACFYTTDAPGRLSYGPTHLSDLQTIRDKNRR